jgi:ferric-dicitrate binding protein FerR (iron transport regulator)
MLQERAWLLIGRKMADEASPQELRELADILKYNPELHFSLQALTDFWQQTPPLNSAELEQAYAEHLSKMKVQISDHPGNTNDLIDNSTLYVSAGKSFFSRKFLMLASLALAVIITAVAVFYSVPSKHALQANALKHVASEISTRYGSKTTSIVLPDGTKVWLNAGSKLTYDKNFGESVRNVKLTGEAYFDVVHNADKPFVIHTTAMDIKVLGTEFNVKSYPDENTTEASLIRGSIEVTLKDKRAEKIIMKPNEKLVVSNESAEEVKAPALAKKAPDNTPIINLGHLNYFSLDSTILETSWVNNRLVFEDESFQEVATRMARWYGVDFEFGNEDVKQLRFTGNFKNETVQEALKAMQITADFSFRVSSDKHIVITKN